MAQRSEMWAIYKYRRVKPVTAIECPCADPILVAHGNEGGTTRSTIQARALPLWEWREPFCISGELFFGELQWIANLLSVSCQRPMNQRPSKANGMRIGKAPACFTRIRIRAKRPTASPFLLPT